MRKTQRIGLALSPTEKAAAKQLAEMEGGLTYSALMRRLIRKEAHEQGIWPPRARELVEAA